MEGITGAVLEERYRKRMVRIIAKYFFNVYKSLLLEPGSRYIDRRRNPDSFDLYDICIELSGGSRRVTSNYFLLLQCSHEQNGWA